MLYVSGEMGLVDQNREGTGTVHWEREKCELKASKDYFKNSMKKKHGCRDFRSLLCDLSFIFVYLLIYVLKVLKFYVTWLGTADEN